jgi:hypothetical protein
MADDSTERRRLDMRVDTLTRRRLQALATRLELSQAAIVRMAVRELAERLDVNVEADEGKAAA